MRAGSEQCENAVGEIHHRLESLPDAVENCFSIRKEAHIRGGGANSTASARHHPPIRKCRQRLCASRECVG